MTSKNPFGLRTVTPYLVVDGVEDLISFSQRVFGAVLRGDVRYRDDGSVQHAEISIGDSVIMMGEATDDFEPMPSTLYVYVPDCDVTFLTAIENGASSVLPVQNYPHGDRYGGVQDQSGNLWWIVTHLGAERD
jgi:uncharacterized glyoxalase superfamily protein PhnB